MSTDAPGALRADACPDPEQLAAYIDAGLSPDERTLVERHLVTCPDCREIIGGSVDALKEIRKVRPFPVRRVALVAASILTAAAAVMVVVRMQRPSPYYVPEMEGLVAAASGGTRLIEPRLTGGFGYGLPPQRTRGQGTTSRPTAVTAAASNVALAAERLSSPSGRAAAGVAALFMDDSNAAVSALEDAAAAQPQNPKILSDLSAAYLVRAAAGSSSDVARALDAAEHATRLPDAPPEAWFNRALALEALGGPDRARAGWQEYLRHDPTGPWADEAKRRLEQLPRVTGRAEWTGRLEQALSANDVSTVTQAVEARPDFARDYFDRLIVTPMSTEQPRASAARVIARAIRETTADELPLDALNAASAAAATAPENLRQAHERFAAAKALYEDDRLQESAAAFSSLIPTFERYSHPYRLWCLFYRSIADFYGGRFDAARQTLAAVETEATAREYPYLAARAAWMDGLARGVTGDFSGAEVAYRRALAGFALLRDPGGIASMRQSLAEVERLLGDPEAAWSDVRAALARSSEIDNARTLQRLWAATTNAFLTDDRPYAAATLQPSLFAAAEAWGRPAGIVDALRLQSQTCTAIADRECALRASEASRQTQQGIADETFRQRSELNVVLAEGDANLAVVPERAIAPATRAIDLLQKLGGAQLARAHLLRARAYARSGRRAEAKEDYRAGIEVFEQRRGTLNTEQVSISYFDEAWSLFDELLKLQIGDGDVDGALITAERARARALADWIPGLPESFSIERLQSRIPSGTTFLYYVVADADIYVWALDRQHRSFASMTDVGGRIAREAARFRDDLEAGRWDDTQRSMAADLYRQILKPKGLSNANARRLVISPHGFLHQLPFAALINPDDGEPLLRSVEIAYAPSARLAFTADGRSAEPALLLGDATGDLPGAAAELRTIADALPGAVVRRGTDVSSAAFSDLDYGTVHIATHADVDEAHPFLSRLRLADGPRFAYQLYGSPLAHTSLVVLAGCSTARGAIRRGEGALSLARPFLARGVPSVVATLWDVPDAASAALFGAFHRARAHGETAPSALRHAQISVLDSADPGLLNPRVWAAVAVYSRAALTEEP